jgi:hypothetical protein
MRTNVIARIGLSLILLVSAAACGGGGGGGSGDGGRDPGSAPSNSGGGTGTGGGGVGIGVPGGGGAAGVAAFEANVYPLTRQYCVQCHVGAGPGFPHIAHPDAETAFRAVVDNQKVNLVDPSRSRLVQRLATDRHFCWSNCANDAAMMQPRSGLGGRGRRAGAADPGNPGTVILTIISSDGAFVRPGLAGREQPQRAGHHRVLEDGGERRDRARHLWRRSDDEPDPVRRRGLGLRRQARVRRRQAQATATDSRKLFNGWPAAATRSATRSVVVIPATRPRKARRGSWRTR